MQTGWIGGDLLPGAPVWIGYSYFLEHLTGPLSQTRQYLIFPSYPLFLFAHPPQAAVLTTSRCVAVPMASGWTVRASWLWLTPTWACTVWTPRMDTRLCCCPTPKVQHQPQTLQHILYTELPDPWGFLVFINLYRIFLIHIRGIVGKMIRHFKVNYPPRHLRGSEWQNKPVSIQTLHHHFGISLVVIFIQWIMFWNLKKFETFILQMR